MRLARATGGSNLRCTYDEDGAAQAAPAQGAGCRTSAIGDLGRTFSTAAGSNASSQNTQGGTSQCTGGRTFPPPEKRRKQSPRQRAVRADREREGVTPQRSRLRPLDSYGALRRC